MPSLLAWLDHSEEDQRRMRELVALFGQEESRDELGIGAIRDAFSDRLFPGTSVVQTRARYFLFVPWIYRAGERRKLSGDALREWAEKRERWLIPALKRGGDENGLIGRVAGPGVKILPSTIYWNGLQTFGIARHPGGLDQALRSGARSFVDEADELAERRGGLWHATLPEPPTEFFSFREATFELTREEAEWLAERIVQRVPDSMLGYMVLHRLRPAVNARAPWEDPAVASLSDELRLVVEHARHFSQAIYGAVLLYNLLLARRAARLGFASGELVDAYEGELDDWWREIESDAAFHRWDRDDFWRTVVSVHGRVPMPTVAWVDEWLDRVQDGSAARSVADPQLHRLVHDRERRLKGAKARLINDRLLANWRGASGTGRLVYRWGTVHTQLTDLFEGLDRAGA